MIINKKDIKFKSHLLKLLSTEKVLELNDSDNNFNKWFKIELNISSKILFLNLINKYTSKSLPYIELYFKNNKFEQFDFNRCINFIEFRISNTKDSTSITYFKLLYGNDLYEIKRREKINKGINSLENFIEKFGIIEGAEKYNSYIDKQCKSSKRCIEYWILQGFDLEESKEKLKEYQTIGFRNIQSKKSKNEIDLYNKTNSPWRVEFWINKGFTLEESIEQISFNKKEESRWCIEYWLKKGFSLEESKEKQTKYWFDNCYNKTSRQTSKESLNIFIPIIEIYKNKPVLIYCGIETMRKEEWFLYDKENKKYYFYDFCLIDKETNNKYIIEYNGKKFHPNKEEFSKKEWDDWFQLYTNKTADEVYLSDSIKKDLAVKNGFKFLTVWSNETINNNINIIKEFLKN